MTERARTIFLGSGSFAVPIVEALAAHPSVNLIAVVTAPTRRGSRGRPTDPPVADWATARGLPMLRPARLRDLDAIVLLEQDEPELLVLADYGQIVPSEILALPRHGALNLHPSLLPRHRGASPISATILDGDQEAGVSLILMDEGLDSGPIVAQRRHPLSGMETAPQLESDLAQLAGELLSKSIDPWLARRLRPQRQSARGVTMTRPLRREDGRLDPASPAARLERQVRAYQPWPGSFIDTSDGRIVVWRAAMGEAKGEAQAGTIIQLDRGGVGLTTADGMLELLEVQPAGGGRMSGADLLRGRPQLAGSFVTLPSAASPSASA